MLHTIANIAGHQGRTKTQRTARELLTESGIYESLAALLTDRICSVLSEQADLQLDSQLIFALCNLFGG